MNHASFDNPDFHVFSGKPPAGRMVAGRGGGAAGGEGQGPQRPGGSGPDCPIKGSGGPSSAQGPPGQQGRPQGPRSGMWLTLSYEWIFNIPLLKN